MNTIITVGRQFGSGGRELGRRLAVELGIEYYDKEIITEIARHTSLSEAYVKQVIEQKPHALYPITVGQTFLYVDTGVQKMEQSVYAAQREILLELAQKSSCVIVGRCADYILREQNPHRLFVYADMDARVARCKERGDREQMSDKELVKMIKSIDKNRAKYYEYYTGQTWGDKAFYDLCINTTGVDIKEMSKHLSRMFCK